jgi:hypothetical protein
VHYEYAVEPEAIGSDWNQFRYLIEKFSFDKGRLISQFPKSWFKDVHEASKYLPPAQRTRVELLLRKAKDTKTIRRGRPFDPSLGSWLENARKEHERLPFRAVIAKTVASDEEAILCLDDLSDGDQAMKVRREDSIKRDVPSIVSALRGLWSFSSRLLVVDPYFDPFNKKRQLLFRALFEEVKKTNFQACCEVHYRNNVSAPMVSVILIS